MDALSTLYLEHCAAEREPANTIAARGRVLRLVGNAGSATREDVEAWWGSRAHLSPATRVADLALLRAFYKWCAIWEHREDDPTVRLKPPHVPNRVPRPARRTDVKRLILSLPPDMGRACALGAYLGLRVSESARLSWADIDTDEGMVRVEKSKGGKTRLVPLSPALVDMLGGELPGANVVTRSATEYDPGVLSTKLNRAMKRAGVKATSHQLRHLFGTTAYEVSGGDILAVRDLMGHESTQTTASYARPSADMGRRIADAMLD